MKLNKIIKYIYLAPAGFTMPYNLGICQFIKEHYYIHDYNYIGSSAGAWLSVFLASDMFLSDDLINKYSKNFESSSILYKWHNICPFLIEEFPQYINDKSFVDNKKIKISISQYYNKSITNEFINNYDNLDELLHLCALSSYIPLLSGLNLPKVDNLISFDGYFTKPNFENKNIILSIDNSMFNRHFTFTDVIGKSKINIEEMINLGYYDCIQHKDRLDNIFYE